jgi:hypothetical protein
LLQVPAVKSVYVITKGARVAAAVEALQARVGQDPVKYRIVLSHDMSIISLVIKLQARVG